MDWPQIMVGSFSLLQTPESSSLLIVYYVILSLLWFIVYLIITPYVMYNLYVLSKVKHLISIQHRRYNELFPLLCCILLVLCVVEPLVFSTFVSPMITDNMIVSYICAALFVIFSNIIISLYCLRLWLYFFNCQWNRSSMKLTSSWFINHKQFSSFFYVVKYVGSGLLCIQCLCAILAWFSNIGIFTVWMLQIMIGVLAVIVCYSTPEWNDMFLIAQEMRSILCYICT